jgi:hypothetical protein
MDPSWIDAVLIINSGVDLDMLCSWDCPDETQNSLERKVWSVKDPSSWAAMLRVSFDALKSHSPPKDP